MEFQFGQTVYRDRRKPVVDPYNPARTRPGTWDDPVDTITLLGAAVASSSSVRVASESRTQVITAKSLFLTDTAADVVVNDRIRWGSTQMFVEAKPEADVNPFTGWQPVVEIPLKEVAG